MTEYSGVVIGYVRGELVHGKFMESVIAEKDRSGALVMGQESEPFVDNARNILIDRFMATDKEWFLSVDTDIVLPEHVVTRLLSRGLPLVGALINVNTNPPSPQVYQKMRVYEKLAEGLPWGSATFLIDKEWEPGELVKADATGAGCLLIHRDVFEAIPGKPPARWFQHEFRNTIWFGEDMVFCERAAAAGFQLYIDTSVKAGHLKNRII